MRPQRTNNIIKENQEYKKIAQIKVDDIKENITLEEKNNYRKYEFIEINVKLVDKIILKVIADDGSNISIMLESTMNKLSLKITHKVIIKVRFANQRPFQSLSQIRDLCMEARSVDYVILFYMIYLYEEEDSYSLLLGR